MQKLMKGAAEGELSREGPLNFHHTCQMARA
jgi:hypothetical protein